MSPGGIFVQRVIARRRFDRENSAFITFDHSADLPMSFADSLAIRKTDNGHHEKQAH
jgi:hypothetical protein